MLIICPHCTKGHNIDERRIPATAQKARCTGCGKTFALELPARQEKKAEAAAPVPAPAATRTIGVSLSKGGVGKTTTAVNLAAGLALIGKKVLLIDTDTQGQASFILGLKPKAGLTELVTGELSADEVLTPARDNLSLLAGGRSLAGIKRLIDRKDFGGEMTLCEALKPLEDRFDFVIVDTSPGWDPLTVNVLFYVTELMTPVSLEVMTIQGLTEFLKSIAAIQKYRKDINLKYIVPTFHDKRVKKSDNILARMREIYEDRICDPIRYNVKLSETPAYGKTIFEFAPDSTGAEDYMKLVRRVAGNEKG